MHILTQQSNGIEIDARQCKIQDYNDDITHVLSTSSLGLHMNEVQYLELSPQHAKQGEVHGARSEQKFDDALANIRNSLLSLRDQRGLEVEKHKNEIKEILSLSASLFFEPDSKGMLLISGNDPEELMLAENIFNAFKTELSNAKDAQLQKLIEAITFTQQQPLSRAAIEQVKKNVIARADFLESDDGSSYTSGEIHRLNGSTAENQAALASNWRNKKRIFSIDHKGKIYYPKFQFDDHGKPRKVIAEIIKIFDEDNPGWQLALWFTTPNAVLEGKKPVELIESNPEDIIKAIKEEVDPTLF